MIAKFGQTFAPALSGDRSDAWARYQSIWPINQQYRGYYDTSWMPPIDWTPFVWYEIEGNRTSTKLTTRNNKISNDNLKWESYYDRIFRNFGLDFYAMSHSERTAKIKDMPAIAEAMNKTDSSGKPIISDTAPLNPSYTNPVAAAQYAKQTPESTGNISEKFLKYAPGIGVGLAVFKLFLKG